VQVMLKHLEPVNVASFRCTGPYWKTGENIVELYAWITEKNLFPDGPPMGIYYHNPLTTPPEQCYAEYMVPVEGKVQEEGNFSVKKIPEMDCATVFYYGQFDKEQVEEAYQAVERWIIANNYTIAGTPREVYLNSPQKMAEGVLALEIQIPVQK